MENEEDNDDFDYTDPFLVDDRKSNKKHQIKMEIENGQDSEGEEIIKEVEENLRTANVKYFFFYANNFFSLKS